MTIKEDPEVRYINEEELIVEERDGDRRIRDVDG